MRRSKRRRRWRRTDGSCVFLKTVQLRGCDSAVHWNYRICRQPRFTLRNVAAQRFPRERSFYYAHAAGRCRRNAHLGVVTSEEGGELFAETGYC